MATDSFDLCTPDFRIAASHHSLHKKPDRRRHAAGERGPRVAALRSILTGATGRFLLQQMVAVAESRSQAGLIPSPAS
jgi:hypothetical protein